MPNTCKSDGIFVAIRIFSGARVSNTWVICLQDRDNLPKGGLIPDETTSSSEDEAKGGASYHLEMSPRPIS